MYKDKNKGKKSSLLYQTYTPTVFQKSTVVHPWPLTPQVSEQVIKFNGLSGDRGQQGP